MTKKYLTLFSISLTGGQKIAHGPFSKKKLLKMLLH